MSRLRFRVGEFARIAVAHPVFVGRTCTVMKFAEHPSRFDYRVLVDGHNELKSAWDWQLSKLDPGAETDSTTRCEEFEKPEHLRVGV